MGEEFIQDILAWCLETGKAFTVFPVEGTVVVWEKTMPRTWEMRVWKQDDVIAMARIIKNKKGKVIMKEIIDFMDCPIVL